MNISDNVGLYRLGLKGNGIETEKCLHDQCTECNGTGTKKSGEICVHFISCPCPKCTPRY